ncbi:MAG TPA: hypothetical protein VK509_25495 [Polyangiales bacterium]|nr:hypothetical protein [Polyangiales bacterium]
MTAIESKEQLLAALAREDEQLYAPAPAADVEGLTLTELGHTLCARFGVPVETDDNGLAYAVTAGDEVAGVDDGQWADWDASSAEPRYRRIFYNGQIVGYQRDRWTGDAFAIEWSRDGLSWMRILTQKLPSKDDSGGGRG